MKDFDEARRERLQRDRSFRIAGREFVYRPAVPPEALFGWFDMSADTPEAEAIATIDATIVEFLEPEYREAWREARDPDAENPITRDDMLELARWLLSEQAGRPTGQQSGSSTGPGLRGTSSTDGSSSPVAAASAA